MRGRKHCFCPRCRSEDVGTAAAGAIRQALAGEAPLRLSRGAALRRAVRLLVLQPFGSPGSVFRHAGQAQPLRVVIAVALALERRCGDEAFHA